MRAFVRCFWTVDAEEQLFSKRVFRIMSDGLPGLVFHHYNGSAVFEDAGERLMPAGFIYGQSTTPCTNYTKNPYQAIGAYFEPAVIPSLFQLGSGGLTNQLLNLNELAGHDLNARLLNSRTQAQRLQLLINFIRRQLQLAVTPDLLIEDCIRKMNQDITAAAIPQLQRHYRISERQLERRFKEAVGLTPHQYLRVQRFQYTVRIIEKRKFVNLAELAYASGYADQSHFIRDFKKFSGFTPKGYSSLFQQSKAPTRIPSDDSPTRIVIVSQ